MRKIVCLLLASLALGSCASAPVITPPPPAPPSREVLNQHAIRSEKFYAGYGDTALENRVYPAPAEFIEYLLLDNAANGFNTQPRSATPSPEIAADIKAAILGMPPEVRTAVAKKLTGIFLVSDLGGSAFTDSVYAHDHAATKGFIVLDLSTTDRKANDWLTWKENSPFKPDASYRLTAELETGARNDRVHAIQFILLHEFGHVLAIGSTAHPLWGAALDSGEDLSRYRFLAQSWRLQQISGRPKYHSIHDSVMPERTKIRFYATPGSAAALDAEKMGPLYAQLQRTNFFTLYGSTSPFDDFAEAFAVYVHGVLLHRPYRVTLSKGGKRILTFTPCLGAKHCRGKRAALIELLTHLGIK